MLKRLESLESRFRLFRRPIVFSSSKATGGDDHTPAAHHDHHHHAKEPALDPTGKFYLGTNIEKVDVYERCYVYLGDPNPQTDMPIEVVPPTPRTTVEFNGRTYPYPYRSLWEEEDGPAVMQRLHREGYVNKDGFLRAHKLPRDEKLKLMQFWFQRETDNPIWMHLSYDPYVYRLIWFTTLCVFVACVYVSYKFVTPKNENIFLYDNWKRWNAEKKH